MRKDARGGFLKDGWQGIVLTVLLGSTVFFLKKMTKSDLFEPLVVSLVLGIVVRAFLKDAVQWRGGLLLAMKIFIPIGIVFYALKNLNLVTILHVEKKPFVLLLGVALVYFAVILGLGKLLKQKKEITFLVANGSAICGSSAIAITASAIDADLDDVSISLLSVTVVTFVGLFLILPFSAVLLNLDNYVYALLNGCVLQVTGFIKVAMARSFSLTPVLPAEKALSLAMLVKSARYLGLLVSIPVFASLVRKRVVLPLALWLFVGAGLAGSCSYAFYPVFYNNVILSLLKPVYNFFWCMAMAAIGLNAEIEKLLTDNGIKALIMAAGGFLGALLAFFVGWGLITMIS